MARPEERKFLGFSISNDGSERRIAPKALDKFKGWADPRHDTPDTRVQFATVDQRAEAIHRRVARLLRFLPDSASPHEPRSVEPSKIAFVSLAARANQAKPLRGVTPSRRSKVPGGGRRWFSNRALAHVRTSGGPASPTQRLFRVARSSPNLCARPSLTRSNRRGRGPVRPVVWEGWRGEASPYPDQSPRFNVTVRRSGGRLRLRRRTRASSHRVSSRRSGSSKSGINPNLLFPAPPYWSERAASTGVFAAGRVN